MQSSCCDLEHWEEGISLGASVHQIHAILYLDFTEDSSTSLKLPFRHLYTWIRSLPEGRKILIT